MKNEAAIFMLAVQFLTRLPVPAATLYTPERLTSAVRYYPLVGLLIGSICAATFWALDLVFPTFLALILSMAIGILVTGAFHEDGLADTFDGIGGGQSRDQALSIMRDSRVGTYGALALILALLTKFAGLIALPSESVILALILAHSLSRLSSIIVIATSNYARTDGKAKPVAQGVTATSIIVGLMTGLVSLAIASTMLPAFALAAGLGGAAVGHVGMRLLFERKIGGYTGDTLGAVQQSSEIGFYLGLVACLS